MAQHNNAVSSSRHLKPRSNNSALSYPRRRPHRQGNSIDDVEVSVYSHQLMSAKKVHEIYGPPFTPSWLERRRVEGGGPRFLKTSKTKTAKVYYRAVDIETWIEANLYTSTSDPGSEAA